MVGLRRLALILGFLGWATLAYALVVILAHDGALVIVNSLGPWEPWLDVVAVAFAVSVTGTALVREYRVLRVRTPEVPRLRSAIERGPDAVQDSETDPARTRLRHSS